jgi:hypothetical protein
MEWRQPVLLAALMDAHVPDQAAVDIHPRVEDEAILGLLQLMQEKHDDYRRDQRSQSRVECHAEPESDSRYIAMQSPLRILQRAADAAHCSNKADRWNGPRSEADHRQLRIQPVDFVFALGAHGLG